MGHRGDTRQPPADDPHRVLRNGQHHTGLRKHSYWSLLPRAQLKTLTRPPGRAAPEQLPRTAEGQQVSLRDLCEDHPVLQAAREGWKPQVHTHSSRSHVQTLTLHLPSSEDGPAAPSCPRLRPA